MFKRSCPNCNCDLFYTNVKNRNQAEKNNLMCKGCSFLLKKIKTLKNTGRFEKRVFDKNQSEYIISQIKNPKEIKRFVDEVKQKKKDALELIKITKKWFRNCPACNKEIEYSIKVNRDLAEKNKSECLECCAKKRSQRMLGENNHFFGKHHNEDSKKKIKQSQNNSEKYKKFIKKVRSQEHREMLSNLVSGDKNPRFKKGSLYDIWAKKYGEEEAKRKNDEYIKKISLASIGKNNNMYGKPSPKGSGNGWSGWYKKWFFRSIHELSYMINVIEKNNLKWESAEKKKYMIEYNDYEGKKRNYFSDFIIEENRMIEIKPERLKKSKNVILKCKAAEIFCKKNGYKFEIVTPKILTDEEIKNLYLKKEIKFLQKYEEKFKKKFNI